MQTSAHERTTECRDLLTALFRIKHQVGDEDKALTIGAGLLRQYCEIIELGGRFRELRDSMGFSQAQVQERVTALTNEIRVARIRLEADENPWLQ